MTCPVLTLVNEVFAPPIEQVVIPKVPVAGEWGGIQVMSGADATTAIVAVNITTHLDTTNQASPQVTVTMPVAGGATRSVIFPWAATGSGMFTQLNAAHFTNANFMVVKYTADPQNGGPYESRYAIFDLRTPAAGTMPPQPVVLGPFNVPGGSDEQFCPNTNGQLVLIWRGLNPGCVANVYRTEISFGVTSIQPLINVNDPNAVGTIACQITNNGAAGFGIALYDQAFRQGNTAVSLTANSRMLATDTIKPGHLKLSVRTLAMTVNQNSLPFVIANDGRDFLEVTGITATGTGFAITPMVSLPKCLLPSETLPVTVARAASGALADTITIATTPAAAAGANTIAVSAAAAAPVTRVTVMPLMLSWLAGDTTARSVTIRNAGTVAVDVSVTAPAAGSAFTWTALATATLAPSASSTVAVTPPAAPAAAINGALSVNAFVTGTATPLTGFPVSVVLSAGVTARVPPGALKIATIVADPPGDDMMPEGEFIEIINVTGTPLDLTHTRIDQTVFSQQSASGHFAALRTFGPSEFGADSMLPPFANGNGPTLRILTRGKKANDITSPWRIYLGRQGPVWNNTGDTGRIINEFGQTVDQYTYVTSLPSAGLPPGTVYSQPAARHLAMVRRVYVNTQMDWTTVFDVQEGDLINITASGTAGFGGFFGSAGTWGPDGKATDIAPDGWPLPGVPKFSLIADIGGVTQMFIGSSGTITVNRSGGPFVLSLGPNDDGIGDNNGDFDCVATLYR